MRLDGWRWRRRRRAGWWRASDGEWYPPSLAWHPAARDEPDAPRRRVVERVSLEGGKWVALATLLALLLVLVAGGLVSSAGIDAVETFGPANADADAVGEGEPVAPPDERPGATPGGDRPAGPVTGTVTTGPPPTPPTTPTPTGGPPTGTPTGPGAAGAATAEEPVTPEVGPAEAGPQRPKSPRDPDDCLHGGWTDLVDEDGRAFDNQGHCVSYAHGTDDPGNDHHPGDPHWTR